MPFQITCPHCRAAYPVDDDLHGRSIRCRECEQPLRAEGPLVGRSWHEVHSGLKLLFWSTGAELAAVIVSALALLIALTMLQQAPAQRASRPTREDDGAMVIDIIVSLLIGLPAVFSVICGLVGQLRCCSVPAATGARLPVILSFCVKVLALLASGPLVVQIVTGEEQNAVPEWLLSAALAMSGGTLLAEILLLVFFYRVGSSLREPAVKHRVERVGILMVCLMVLAVIGGFALAANIGSLLPEQQTAPASNSPLRPQNQPAQQVLTEIVQTVGVYVLFVLAGITLLLLFYLDLLHVTRKTLASRFADNGITPDLAPAVSMPARQETAAIQCAPSPATGSNVMSEPTDSPPYFHALAVFACKSNRLYRIYVRPDELVYIWAGSGMEGVAGAHAAGAMHGALGALLAFAIAKALDPSKKNEARKQVLDSTPLDKLIGDHPKNLRVPLNEVEEVRILPRSERHAGMYSDHAHQALLLLRHRSLGKYRLGISSVEDVRVALKELPRVLGDVCRIEIEWSEPDRKFVKRKV